MASPSDEQKSVPAATDDGVSRSLHSSWVVSTCNAKSKLACGDSEGLGAMAEAAAATTPSSSEPDEASATATAEDGSGMSISSQSQNRAAWMVMSIWRSGCERSQCSSMSSALRNFLPRPAGSAGRAHLDCSAAGGARRSVTSSAWPSSNSAEVTERSVAC